MAYCAWEQSPKHEQIPNLFTQRPNSHLLRLLMNLNARDFKPARCRKVNPTLKENAMDTNTLLLIVIVLLVLGGGYYGLRRWF
jgi:hypothetical protein